MRSKRLFAMLLALCMLFSLVSPAALAVEVAPQNSVAQNVNGNNQTSAPNKLQLTEEQLKEMALNTLRDLQIDQKEVELNEATNKGAWEIAPGQKPDASLLPNEAPACLNELKLAGETIDANELVSAFVVMADKPLAETHNSIRQVSAETKKLVLDKQNTMISAIERMVLNGEKLDVRYQFAYLTNAFTITTEFKNLEKIANMAGVKTVFLVPTYNAIPTDAESAQPNTSASGAMTGVHQVWEDLGYTGQGMKIAIVDTGLDLDHPSFAAAPVTTADSLTAADIASVLHLLNATNKYYGLKAEDLYRSEKVPFAFNYVDRSLTADHSRDQQGDHGTHVAGIAAANKVEGTTVVGMAPDAQIIVMKVFGAAGGAYADDYVAAIEDAMTLGCDVVNLSLGSPAGFSSSDSELDLIFERIASQDTIVTMSAGNEGTSSYGNMWGTDLNLTTNPENGTIGSPSLYANGFSIASAENCVVMTSYFELADGSKIFYMDSYEYLLGQTNVDMQDLVDQELEYVVIDGLGAVEDFYAEDGTSLVEGKVAVILRGELSFSEKAFNAQNAGAAAAIIWNNNPTEDVFSFGMNTTNQEDGSIPGIPVCLIPAQSGEVMAAAEVKTLTVSGKPGEREAEGGQMSSFSSWGTTSDLRLVPDITGIGGNVFSCYDDGQYGLMSGTSMSSPQIAGVSALVLQYLKELYPNAMDGQLREIAEFLMMSTAKPIVSTASGVEASPRQQGSGLIDAAAAVTSEAYLTVGGNRPKAELGDNATGVFTFSFEIHNLTAEEQTYTLKGSALGEDFAPAGADLFFMYEQDYALEDTTVSFNRDTVIVPANGRANVTVTVAMGEYDKYVYDIVWPNGSYVEGFIYLDNVNDEAQDLSLPYMGFYGDWTEAPVFDSAFWWENTAWSYATPDGMPDGNQYYTMFWTNLGGSDWLLGMNPYSGAVLGEDGYVMYDPANNAVSPNGDGLIDGIEEIYLSLLRNAKYLNFTYTVDGEVVHVENMTNASKTMYRSNYGQIVPWLYSWYGWDMYDFTDAQGKPLPSGTEVLLTINAAVDYKHGGEHTLEIPMVVDTTKPELIKVYELPQEDGSHYLAIEAYDDTLAAILLLNKSGSRILGGAYDYMFQETADGTYLAFVDITGLGTEFTIALGDYAANESYFDITYSAAEDGNMPEMDTSKLYGYRVNDSIIWEVNGYDYQFGWVSMNLPENDPYGKGYIWVEAETQDYMEHYAINAAAYAGGKVFAVDAGGNFMVMDAGLWNRDVITNLGMNVVDMAFDDSTDTMYLLESHTEYGYIALHSVDLLTGVTEELYTYWWGIAPWAITVDENGTIYAIARDDSTLYTLDSEFALVPVTDANGSAVVLTDMYGDEIAPYYAQSMTYSDGKIYYGYFLSNYMGSYSELIVIDTNDFSFAGYPYVAIYEDLGAAYMNDTGLVGMLFLEETEYTIPEATELMNLRFSEEHLVMNLGHEERLSVLATPWNYELGEVTFTSSDESVATVSANGTVTAVGGGNAFITATYGDFTAECLVTVVDVKGNYYGYAYYSGDGYTGYFIDVDLATMDYELVGMSMADFIAGDFNGHDGLFYGYTEGGQLYSVNFANGETAAIGGSCGVIFMDMAYDYTTGLMYGISVDYMSGTTLYAIDLKSGKIFEQAVISDLLMTLAIDGQGQMFCINYEGYLVQLGMMEDWFTGELTFGVAEYWMEGLGTLEYLQSMCYDHTNDVFIWANPETSTVFWLDLNDGMPYVLPLGNPTGTSVFQHVGMFTIPDEIPALPEVAVETVDVENMFLLTGQVADPAVSIQPLNANGYTVEITSSDDAVVSVVEGMLVANAAGEAMITVVVNDIYGTEPFTAEFKVTVAPGADNLFGFLMADILTYESGYWMNIDPAAPKAPELVNYMDYTIYAQEHVDGKIYAVGYSNLDYTLPWQMLIMDAESFELLEVVDLAPGYPFVYDMTYDHTTSTMYCVAGPSDSASDLYIMDMETGELTMIMSTAPFLMALAAGPEGKLYSIAMSEEAVSEDDFWDPWAPVTYAGAVLYAIDPVAGTMEEVGNTDVVHAALTSMTYDYDTGYLYWTPLDMNTMAGGLAITDPATAETFILGTIGTAGAQVTGLYVLADEYPEAKAELMTVKVNPEKDCLTVGDTLALKAVTIAAGLDAEFVWTTSDENVATVDAEGNVTAVAPGIATITVTVTAGGVTKTAECAIGVLAADATFLTYNVTDNAWATISRGDMTVVENVADASEYPSVEAFTAIDDVVYGIDAMNTFFMMTTDTYERTDVAALDVNAIAYEYLLSMGEDEETAAEEAALYDFWARDLAYDAANDRLLLLGNLYDAEWGKEWYADYSFCIYEVDMTDGSLNLLWQNWNDDGNIVAITVGPDGIVYYYSAFDDYYTALDLTTGEATDIVSLYRLGYYGATEFNHSLYYDEVSGLIYHLFTSNGTFSRMFTLDPASGEVALASEYVGEAFYNEDTWTYEADVFVGMTYIAPELENGWVLTDGLWYYFINGVKQTGWEKVDGIWYYMDATGAMQTGWELVDGTWYYLNAYGAMQTGWLKLADTWFYLNSAGAMQTGWVNLAGNWYYLDSTGAMQTGWELVGGTWYYMDASGIMQTGWVMVNGTWYYLDSTGAMQTGWILLGDTWYFLDATGAMVTGTQVINGVTYNFADNGAWIP